MNHDTGHAMRVYKVAMYLADHKNGCDRMIVALAALLHDADDHKLFDTKNNENARTLVRAELSKHFCLSHIRHRDIPLLRQRRFQNRTFPKPVRRQHFPKAGSHILLLSRLFLP
ncbi:MAG: HD domain-containing protein [Lachnospiraceae bacterium]|nr:HD domain-containing protein [Lachnospiraceae bacterium]